MAKAMRRVSAMHWPTQHLVLWRSTIDDVPLALIPDRRQAMAYALAVDERDAKAAHRVMGIDFCSPINVTVVTFRNGRPVRMRVIKELDEAPEPAPQTDEYPSDKERSRLARSVVKKLRRRGAKCRKKAGRRTS